MPKRFALAALVLCIAALGATPAPPARPPDGTYTYAISGVPSVTQTTIVIRTNGSIVSTIEHLSAGGSTISTQADYDAQTLLTTHDHIVGGGATTDVSVSDGTAALAGSDATRTKLPNTVGPVVGENLFAIYTMLPSIVAANGGQSLSYLAVNGLGIYKLTPAPATDPRPTGVPAGDVETALLYPNDLRETAWSNPQTHLVDRVDIGGATLTLLAPGATAPPAPTPYPTAQPHFSSRNVSFASSGGATMAGTLTIPSEPKPHRMPAFVFIHGSGPGTRDGGVEANPTFLDLSNALSNNGVVVLRYDKRGIGKSTGTATEDWHVLGDDARAAVEWLKHQPSVDPNRIFLLGHSEGGEIAPLIAPSIPHLAGIVLMAGPAIPMERVIDEQVPGAGGAKLRSYLLAGLASYVGIDPAKVIAKVNAPILVLQGGRDINILASDLPHLVNAARAAHRNLTVKILPQDDHLFLRLAPGTPNDHSEYAVPAPLDPRVPQTILAWLRSLPTAH